MRSSGNRLLSYCSSVWWKQKNSRLLKRPRFFDSAGFPNCWLGGLSRPPFHRATGTSPQPAGWKTCATFGFGESAESSFFCRQAAGSTLRCAGRGALPPSPTASQSSKNLAQSLSNEINDLEGRLDLQPKGRREINQTRARGGNKNGSKLRRQILVPEPFFPTSA